MDYLAFYRQLKEGAIQRLYLFEGEEEYGKESALTALRQAVLSGPMAMMNESVLTNPDDSQLIAVCETLPIMEERRLVIVRDSAHLSGRARGKGQAEAEEEETPEEPKRRGDSLTPYLDRLPDSVCLVFFVRGKANASRRLYKKIRDLGGIVSFDQLDQTRLLRWIQKEFESYDLQIGRQASEQLVFACGKELMHLKQEIAKIAASAAGKQTVDLADIQAIATLSVEYKVFDLADKVSDGKAAQALPLLADMLRAGEARLMLLALLQRHYRQLLLARIQMDQRASQMQVAELLGLPPFIAGRIMQSARGYEAAQLSAAYQACINQEFLVKSGQLAEEGSLEALVLRLLHLRQEGGSLRA